MTDRQIAVECPSCGQGVDVTHYHRNIERLQADLAAMTADRDSWEQQASDRVDDALEAYARAERAEADNAALMEVVRVMKLIGASSGEGYVRNQVHEALDALPAHIKEEASK